MELTGVWINEAREIPKSIIDACTMRVGRYPSMREGGASWSGVIADTNAPEEDHWWATHGWRSSDTRSYPKKNKLRC